MIILSKASASDHSELVKLFNQAKCTSGFGNILYSGPTMYERGWIVQARTNLGKLVGAYCVRHCTRKPQTSLYFITVDKDHQGTEVSGLLMEHLKANCPSGTIVLGVLENNDRARAFYKKHGFVVTGPAYAGKGFNMEWTIL